MIMKGKPQERSAQGAPRVCLSWESYYAISQDGLANTKTTSPRNKFATGWLSVRLEIYMSVTVGFHYSGFIIPRYLGLPYSVLRRDLRNCAGHRFGEVEVDWIAVESRPL